MKAEEEMDAGMAFLPRDVFGAMDLKPGQTVTVSVVDVDGDSGEVQVKIMGAEEVEDRDASDHEMTSDSPMVAGIDELPNDME